MKTTQTITILLALLLAFAFSSVVAQESLPEYGTISDLKGMTKVYVSAPSTKQRDTILSELKKAPNFTVVSSADDAQFFLDYRIVDSHMTRFSLVPIVTAELAAYTLKNGRKRIAWSETKQPKMHATENTLPQSFIKAFKKLD